MAGAAGARANAAPARSEAFWIVDHPVGELSSRHADKPAACGSLEETELPGPCRARLMFDHLADSFDRPGIAGSFKDLQKACGRVRNRFGTCAKVVAAASGALRSSGLKPVSFRDLEDDVPSFEAPGTRDLERLDDALDKCCFALADFLDKLSSRVETLHERLDSLLEARDASCGKQE